ncbi:MAG: 5'-methylthioadenosine/S-adenosylhomocysteine nucleosidase [Candidatus Tectomicrobia bacterium]|nr:5'-methylthioadenosine/S-adenosylhomocysteine nucleosidase [Candidatus Tectomicrobia bacterium]
MKILVVLPIRKEIDAFRNACVARGFHVADAVIGRLPVVLVPDLGLTFAHGGLGKVQFAVQTQHLLDVCPDWDLAICAGAAGALVDELAVGDAVVATETVEHDINNHFGPPRLPRFCGIPTGLESLKRVAGLPSAFRVHFGPIASGDEDVVEAERREVLHRRTGALAVAWEGAGGARACCFSDVPFIEIRGVTDRANGSAAVDFRANLETALGNVAALILTWVRMHGLGEGIPRQLPDTGCPSQKTVV